jgi:hypothetical protein
MMKTLPKTMLAIVLLLLAGFGAAAQAQSSKCSGNGSFIFGITLVNARAGCPFSGVMETERSQTLTDGMNIHTKKKTLVYRDSAGRLRYENFAAMDADKDAAERQPTMIQIYDPVAGFRYEYQPGSGVARRTAVKVASTGLKGDSKGGELREEKSRPNFDVEKLGTQKMEGILAMGTKIAITIPAGTNGNDRDITTVTETWKSSEMGITLLEKLTDPRYGDSERRITNLELSEPDAALFEVPADYTIQDR